ncbi:unnamed protein product [Didymodactylos carnosus]|uniref:Uncharacterized protein n=1 Tax=Didymodactylos carnosus TaxID=1234261 RepID=A0A813U547_9BILA|nr:unnamed protein product [Didymodactylos carnosus]CAF1314321.1 unnamed protein product [Didymodactylos carnosus]CAF3605179.1 unnamed protein product [Didymodactylos carnosus]CAF4122967.1 unnamed protein product [Didymodactylos carnosus]
MLRRPPELPRSINDRLNRLANTVFTPTKYDAQLSPDYLNFRQRIEVDYASSLPLQMLLYFNLCFFPCWLFSHIFVLPVLTISNSNQHIILMIFAFVFKAIIEIVRLYLGYAGNLGERMPELTAFCLLTIIFQVPLTLFLLLYQIIAMIQICMALILAVRDARPMIDSRPPRTYMHLHMKLKKLQLEEERLATVERDNRILLEKMSTIMRTTGRVENRNDYNPKSLNHEKRRRELLRVSKENSTMIKRITNRKADTSREAWERNWSQNMNYANNISKYDVDWHEHPKPSTSRSATDRHDSVRNEKRSHDIDEKPKSARKEEQQE